MSRPRILIVDDEQHIVSLLSMTLGRNGYEVLTADNGPKALEIASAFELDLMIVDYSMPGMTGAVLTERIDATVPVLMVTARPEITALTEPNCAGVIHKPFSPRVLVAKVLEIVGPGTLPKEQSA